MKFTKSVYSDGIVVVVPNDDLEWLDVTKDQVAFLVRAGVGVTGTENLDLTLPGEPETAYTKEYVLLQLRGRYEALIKRRDNAASMDWYTTAMMRSNEAQAIDTLIDDIENGGWDE